MYCTVLYCADIYLSVILGGFFDECPYTARICPLVRVWAATQPDMMEIIGEYDWGQTKWNLEWNGELLWL